MNEMNATNETNETKRAVRSEANPPAGQDIPAGGPKTPSKHSEDGVVTGASHGRAGSIGVSGGTA
jgi:hypothetical protein